MAANLTPEQLAEAIRLQARCWTQTATAEALGVHQSTVSRALATHNRRALAALTKKTADTKARQLSQLEWMAAEAADAWVGSRKDAESVKTLTGSTGDAAVNTTESTIKGQSGNPALLKEARGALADIRAILGLDQEQPEQPSDDFTIDLSDDDPTASDPSQRSDTTSA